MLLATRYTTSWLSKSKMFSQGEEITAFWLSLFRSALLVQGTLRILEGWMLQIRETSEGSKLNSRWFKLPLTIITIIQCVSANTTRYHLLGAGANQSSVNSVSTQCQVVSTSIKLPVPSRCQKSSFQVALQKKLLSAASDSESQILDQSLLQAL